MSVSNILFAIASALFFAAAVALMIFATHRISRRLRPAVSGLDDTPFSKRLQRLGTCGAALALISSGLFVLAVLVQGQPHG